MRHLAIVSAFAVAVALGIGGSATSAFAQDAQPAAKVAPASAPATKSDAALATAPATKVEPKADVKKDALPQVDPEKPGEILKFIVTAFKEGKWAWAVGLILMLLTLIFNKLLKDKIPKKVVPWVAIGLGVASSTAMSLASGVGWLSSIGTGLTVGLAAIGGWEAFGKLFKKKPAESSGSTS